LNRGFIAFSRNFGVNIGRAVCEASSTTWNLSTNAYFAEGPRKTTEKLDRIWRSQNLPGANRFLTRSPAFKYTNSKANPYLCFAFFLNIYRFVLQRCDIRVIDIKI
jgi:hypothetical protein